MSVRAVIIGLGLGGGISAFTYFNDFVIRQTMLVGNFFPFSVFGGLLLTLLLVNPLLVGLGRRWPLSAAELAVITGLLLAACGWPGSNFGRYVGTLWTMPNHWQQTRPDWQAQHVMSYLPGGSAELGQGHVQDWPALLNAVLQGAEQPEASAGGRIWALTGSTGQRAFVDAADLRQLSATDISELTRAINRALHDPAFHTDAAFEHVTLPQRAHHLLDAHRHGRLPEHELVELNRLALVAAMPEAVMPPPPGRGALVDGGRMSELVDDLIAGHNTQRLLPYDNVPWSRWWPTLRLWGGAVLLLGLASLCMALIVHPQWSRRELLAYPVARFVEEVTQRGHGHRLPRIMRAPLFWMALAGAFGMHLLNGLDAWFDTSFVIERRLNFNALRDLFPYASRTPGSWGMFQPTIFLSVVGFSFFISRQIALSLGLAQLLFMMVGAAMLANGIAIEYDKFTPNNTNMMRTGAYLGVALMILYTGRRYYASVAAGALGASRGSETPLYAVWAARGFAVTVLAATWWMTSSGMDWSIALMVVGLCLLIWLVMTRIVCETGTFFLSGPVLPIGVFPGLLGYEALGPTGLLLMGIAGIALVIDPREAVMPYVANALRMAERTGTAPRRIAPALVVMLVAGLLIATVVTLVLQYEHGAPMHEGYTAQRAPTEPFDELSRANAEMLAQGRLAEATGAGFIERLGMIRPQPGRWSWLLVGLGLVVAFSAARLRLPWWPLHPVIWLVWGTWAMAQFGFSFLLGWAIKAATVRIAGLRGFEALKPLMIGLIAGELLGALLWVIVGTGYYFTTGVTPQRYGVFP